MREMKSSRKIIERNERKRECDKDSKVRYAGIVRSIAKYRQGPLNIAAQCEKWILTSATRSGITNRGRLQEWRINVRVAGGKRGMKEKSEKRTLGQMENEKKEGFGWRVGASRFVLKISSGFWLLHNSQIVSIIRGRHSTILQFHTSAIRPSPITRISWKFLQQPLHRRVSRIGRQRAIFYTFVNSLYTDFSTVA